ncbi:unnamed protein product [Rodentolepis nana]|uniref:SH3 domain-containing protein n=1 Tax=Rodentolepis nana TaxID=102285 RepID=A0A0R3TWT0_RODNA|nr:unnamed protein product [Rodentolepis nana]
MGNQTESKDDIKVFADSLNSKEDTGWWRGFRFANGPSGGIGMFPANRVSLLPLPYQQKQPQAASDAQLQSTERKGKIDFCVTYGGSSPFPPVGHIDRCFDCILLICEGASPDFLLESDGSSPFPPVGFTSGGSSPFPPVGYRSDGSSPFPHVQADVASNCSSSEEDDESEINDSSGTSQKAEISTISSGIDETSPQNDFEGLQKVDDLIPSAMPVPLRSSMLNASASMATEPGHTSNLLINSSNRNSATSLDSGRGSAYATSSEGLKMVIIASFLKRHNSYVY